MRLDGEAGAMQSVREARIVLRRPHAEATTGTQRDACALETAHAVKRGVARCGERVGTVIDVEQDRVERGLLAMYHRSDVLDAHLDTRIVERTVREVREWTAIPRDDLGDELGDRDLRFRPERSERSARGESHAEPAEQHVRIRWKARAPERCERLLGLMHAAVHELGATMAENELITALDEDELAIG